MTGKNVRLMLVSGAIAVILLALLLSGWADRDDKVQSALRLGNKSYEAGAFEDTLRFYETGLEADPRQGDLLFNAGQAAYQIGDYESAARYYENARDCVEKYLNYGNIFYRAGAALEDAEQKAKLFAGALEIYMDGIKKYPEDVSLKYNYEFVKALFDALLDELEQQQNERERQGEGESEDSEQSDGGQGDGEQGDGGQGEGEQGDGGQGDGEQGDGGQGDGEQDERGAGESADSEQNNGEQGEDDSSGQSGDNEEESDDGDNTDDREAQGQQSEEPQDTDQEAIARILEALESREEESLKNNQRVIRGKADGNGW